MNSRSRSWVQCLLLKANVRSQSWVQPPFRRRWKHHMRLPDEAVVVILIRLRHRRRDRLILRTSVQRFSRCLTDTVIPVLVLRRRRGRGA